MTEQQEKKNQRVAMVTSLGIHAALFLLFFFMVAWRAPNPPLPEYGIELNFGMDVQGSGEVQPRTPVGSQGTEEEEPEQPEPVEEEQEEPQAEPQPAETQPVQQEAVSELESPVKVEEKKKEEVKEPEKPKVEPRKEEVVKPKVDENAVFKPQAQTPESSNKTTQAKAGEEANQGDDKEGKGDKGNPEGSLDAKALYGKQGGGGGGPSLDLAGWTWDYKPNPEVPNNETGIVQFEIKVDDNGEIISIRTLQRGVSIEAEQACKRAIQRLTFSKTGENVPSISTGKITFVIRAK